MPARAIAACNCETLLADAQRVEDDLQTLFHGASVGGLQGLTRSGPKPLGGLPCTAAVRLMHGATLLMHALALEGKALVSALESEDRKLSRQQTPRHDNVNMSPSSSCCYRG